MIDGNATNNFDVSKANFTTSSYINTDYQSNKYIHIKAIDNAGNISDVSDLKISFEYLISLNTNGGSSTLQNFYTSLKTNVNTATAKALLWVKRL